mmetsp:Transcript_44474/g.50338  ORF Transcript_44474/g.50338 Transcript_44474/m.50338 type:complete len:197 (+) Transcript_44474:20-610(+)
MKCISIIAFILLLIEPTVGFIVQSICNSLPVVTRFSPFGFVTRRYNNSVENKQQQEEEASSSPVVKQDDYDGGGFDLDDIESMEELLQLSSDIGGPEFLIGEEEISLEKARDILWAYVEETAEDDIDDMCMGQLGGLMVSLKGGEIPDNLDLSQARDYVWEFVVKHVACSVNELGTGNCECFSCSNVVKDEPRTKL